MSRYIDAKNLTLIKNLANLISECEVIDIVRCKECKYCADDYIDVGMGTMPQFTCEMGIGGDVVSPDDYCSYGEREGE